MGHLCYTLHVVGHFGDNSGDDNGDGDLRADDRDIDGSGWDINGGSSSDVRHLSQIYIHLNSKNFIIFFC